MLLTFRELNQRTGPLQWEEEVRLDGMEKENPDLIRLEPVKVGITAWKDQGLFHVQGEQSAKATLRCSRCLSGFDRVLSARWHRVFTDDENRVEPSGEEEILLVSLDRPTDLTPYIREALLLSMPFAPVCREECKGLCPTCGTDWNRASCQCDNRRIDPRLAKLGELLNRDP
ncbi:YceD family protein [Kroppenstedtia eburnea]|uniref:YceD family protein n=1 Tax=Kroppenstedtia eburnea TaxID=714067 RepID=UPI00363032D0